MRDPVQYARFSDERSRPFRNLLERVPQRDFKTIVDLGCGSGDMTVSLAERWPSAKVLGLDYSPGMLSKSGQYEIPGRLEFKEGHVEDYDERRDLIYSNATMQWVGDHDTIFPKLAGLVNPGGVIATQMPYSHVQRSHELIEETARSGPWKDKLADWRRFQVQPLSNYIEMFQNLGFSVDAWETTYYFVLQGKDPIVEWVKGTSLQPILTLLTDDEKVEFTERYAAALREAYPPTSHGTIYPFQRIFFVASRD